MSAVSCVRVLVWRQMKERDRPIGHVALETHTGGYPNRINYISFWPGICHGGRSHHHTYDQDCTSEHTPPDVVYTLRTLKVDKINQAFSRFLASDYEWGELGSGFLRRPYERNCSGLALYLLEKGKIRDLVPRKITKNSKRIALAAFITALVFAVVTYKSYSKYFALKEKEKHLDAFMKDYLLFSIADKELYNHLSNIDKQAQKLLGAAKKKPGSTLTQEHAAAILASTGPELIESPPIEITRYKFKDIHTSVSYHVMPSLKSVNQFNEANLPIILRLVRRSTAHFGYLATLAVAGFAFYNLSIINNMILKTVTPADVENIAHAAESAEAAGRTVRNRKTRKIIVCGSIVAAGLGGIALLMNKKQIKRS